MTLSRIAGGLYAWAVYAVFYFLMLLPCVLIGLAAFVAPPCFVLWQGNGPRGLFVDACWAPVSATVRATAVAAAGAAAIAVVMGSKTQ